MQAFHKLFTGKPNPSTMSAELNAQIITVRPSNTAPHHSTHGGRSGGFKLRLNARPRPCTTTCPARTTCSRCWPGSLSWRRPTSTWQGNAHSPLHGPLGIDPYGLVLRFISLSRRPIRAADILEPIFGAGSAFVPSIYIIKMTMVIKCYKCQLKKEHLLNCL